MLDDVIFGMLLGVSIGFVVYLLIEAFSRG